MALKLTGHHCWLLDTGQDQIIDEDYFLPLDNSAMRYGVPKEYTLLTSGQHSGSTAITVNGKTENKSNNVVVDERTGLMWATTNSASVGPNSDGKLYWNDRVLVLECQSAPTTLDDDEMIVGQTSGASARVVFRESSNYYLGVNNEGGGSFQNNENVVGQESSATVQLHATSTRIHEVGIEDLFEYAYKANKAAFAGYRDWRIPTIMELATLVNVNIAAGDLFPDDDYFDISTNYIYSSTGHDYNHIYGDRIDFDSENMAAAIKSTTAHKTLLVRGPNLSKWRPCLVLKSGDQEASGGGFLDDAVLRPGEDRSYTVLDSGQYSGTVDIVINGKTCQFSNSVVRDNKTGLTWTKTVASSIGPASNGLLYWADLNPEWEDIWHFLQEANRLQVAGKRDWRIPNIFELLSVCNFDTGGSPFSLDSSYFSSAYAQFWSCTTKPSNSNLAYYLDNVGFGSGDNKNTETHPVRLVRGGVKYTDAL